MPKVSKNNELLITELCAPKQINSFCLIDLFHNCVTITTFLTLSIPSLRNFKAGPNTGFEFGWQYECIRVSKALKYIADR